ncbi:hypothetical protein D3C85_725770 [compost metagenome]
METIATSASFGEVPIAILELLTSKKKKNILTYYFECNYMKNYYDMHAEKQNLKKIIKQL